MKLKLALTFVASLTFLYVVNCDDVVITTRRNDFNLDIATIDIRFSPQQFKIFYESLCKTSTYKFFVKLSYDAWETYKPTNQRFVYQNPTNANHPCKYYQCYNYLYSNKAIFICTNDESPSCLSSPNTQPMQYLSADCGNTRCVSIIWKFPEEKVDYSNISDIVTSCNSSCGCSEGMQSTTAATTPMVTVRTAIATKAASRVTTRPGINVIQTSQTTKTTQKSQTTTTKKTRTIKTTFTSKLTTIATTGETSQAETTSQTTVTVIPSTETTSPEIRETTETNITSHVASDRQTPNDPVPIIVGVVVALILVAIIAVVAVFLWKRKKGITQKPPSDCHDYANLPPESRALKGFDTTSSAVSSSQDLPSSYTNYAVIDDCFHYNNEEVRYSSLADHSSHNTVETDSHPYVNIVPSRSHATAPKEGNQTKNISRRPSAGYVTISNTLEDTDDLTNSIYELANQILGPESQTVSNSSTDFNNVRSENTTNKLIPNATAATATTKSHPNAYENDISYPIENTYTNTEASMDRDSLEQTTHPLQVYESAKQIDSSISTDSLYSVSNNDINSDTTYSIAANPTSTTHKPNPWHPHVYAHLGKDAHNIVNPYNALQQTNEAPIPKQAKIPQFDRRKNSDTIQVYSVAEPIPEFPPEGDNYNQYQVIDSTDDEQRVDTNTTPGENTPGEVYPEPIEFNDPSSCQMSHDGVYFQLEK